MGELTPIQQSILDYLTAHISRPTPTVREMADALGMTRDTAANGIYRLKEKGILTPVRKEAGRFYILAGLVHTLPRDGRPAIIPQKLEDEPVRVERWACPRCAAVGCVKHTASMVTSRVAMGWRVYG